MELQQIQHFLVTARVGSVSQAAEELGITQSGLSRSLKTLEDFVGLALFQREARGVTLSDYGQHFLPRATAIWNQRVRAIEEMGAYKALRSGQLKIGIHSVFAYQIGPKALNRFAAEHPDVDVTIIAGADPDLSDRLINAELDFAFTLFVPGVRDSRLIYDELLSMRCGTYARPQHPLTAQKDIGVKDLAAHGWALAGAGAFRQAFNAYFADHGEAAPVRLIQSSSIALLIEIVCGGDFLTILPDLIASSAPIAGRLTRISSETPAGLPRGGLIYRSDRLETPAARALGKIFHAIAAEMPAP